MQKCKRRCLGFFSLEPRPLPAYATLRHAPDAPCASDATHATSSISGQSKVLYPSTGLRHLAIKQDDCDYGSAMDQLGQIRQET